MTTKYLPRIFLAAAGVLIIGALALAWGRSSTEEYDPATPEGVVQSFIKAMLEGDYEAAEAFVDPALLPPLTNDDNAPLPYTSCELGIIGDEITWIGLEDVRIRGDRAVVEIRMTRLPNDVLSGPYDQQESFDLENTGPGWIITRVPYSFCERW